MWFLYFVTKIMVYHFITLPVKDPFPFSPNFW